MGSTSQAKQLSFLDENQNSLSHFSMDVNIEGRAGGDVHTASIHPTVLEKLLGKRPPSTFIPSAMCWECLKSVTDHSNNFIAIVYR